VIATCYGEVFCLDPLTGAALWHNRLKGLGTRRAYSELGFCWEHFISTDTTS
jgi:hypothetical protein